MKVYAIDVQTCKPRIFLVKYQTPYTEMMWLRTIPNPGIGYHVHQIDKINDAIDEIQTNKQKQFKTEI